ncbi:MAG: YIP1 family protein [Gammaproteobacteria bacterium]|nr:YIP1 family protein [Gammaproteobacteria bacterium]MCK5092619.1 YIP1 family protein [Gammaproteobacteria bacterium]
MTIQHITGLLSHPEKEWKLIHNERCTIGKCYCSHVLALAAIPAICGFIGTTQFGWQIGGRDPVMLTTDSALTIAVIFYITMLVAVFSVGKMIQWMAKTYDSEQPLPTCIALSAFTATPLFLIGIMQLYPVLWLNFIVGLPALAYTVYLLYVGLPIMMEISKDKAFLFSSAVIAVGMVMLVAVLAATALLWGFGFEPAFTS